MMPIKHDDGGKVLESSQRSLPYMRGVTEFDDYNYHPYNPNVLVAEVRQDKDDKVHKLKLDDY
jgi:hypothetical protein